MKNKKTLTERRIEFLRSIKEQFDFGNLEIEGPRGGHDAYRIRGWSKSPTAGWTKAAREVGFPEMPWYGPYPYSSHATAFPEELVQEMENWDRENMVYK